MYYEHKTRFDRNEFTDMHRWSNQTLGMHTFNVALVVRRFLLTEILKLTNSNKKFLKI